MATNLGILDDIESEIGITFEELSQGVEKNYGESYSNGDIWWNGILSTLAGTGYGAASGAINAGPWGALIGGALGMLAGIGTGIYTSEKSKKENLQLAKESAKAYEQLVITMTNYAQQKRRQIEIDAYKKKF